MNTLVPSRIASLESLAQPSLPMTPERFVHWVSGDAHPDEYVRAFLEVKDELFALDPRSLSPLMPDPTAAAALVRHQVPRIVALEPELQAQFREFPVGLGQRLETLAWALDLTHLAYENASRPPETLAPALAACVKERVRLARALAPLAALGEVPMESLVHWRTAQSPAEVAVAVRGLIFLIEALPPERRPNNLLSPADLQAAAERAVVLAMAAAGRLAHDDRRAFAAQVRARAWTLLDRAWTRTRAAVAYLRLSERDVDAVCPRLRGALRARPRKKGVVEA